MAIGEVRTAGRTQYTCVFMLSGASSPEARCVFMLSGASSPGVSALCRPVYVYVNAHFAGSVYVCIVGVSALM